MITAFDREGSSPRVRGAATAAKLAHCIAGIIPARAGSSTRSKMGLWASRDHPRACGEQRRYYRLRRHRRGSSPRVRGAGQLINGANEQNRIIPARAGSRGLQWCSMSWHWDHPRACGEQTGLIVKGSLDEGSSPRVRGAVLDVPDVRAESGIIPARAGSRTPAPRSCSRRWDHPRACGEQQRRRSWRIVYPGSSPRVRGAATSTRGREAARGIIPARAGSRVSHHSYHRL